MQINRTYLPATGPIDRADLQALNDLTIALDSTDLETILDDVTDVLGTGVAGKNYFLNPAFDRWTRGTSAILCSVGVRTLRADDWWTRTETGTGGVILPTYSRAADSLHQGYLYAAQITGETGTGAVSFGQDIAARLAAAFHPEITFTFEIYNGTGAAFAPVVRLDTCDALETYGSTTNRYSAAVGTTVANAASAIYTVTLDTTGYAAALRNGAQLYIQIPTGSLSTSSKFVRLYNFKVEIGAAATTRYIEPPVQIADTSDTAASTAERLYLSNGELHDALWLTSSKTLVEDTDTYAITDWWANPSDGSDAVIDRFADSPNTLTRNAARITGATNTTGTVDFGQNVRASNARAMLRAVVFSAWIYNDTGTNFTPSLRIDTAGSEDSFGSVTNRLDQTLDACPYANWTRVSFAFNGSDYTDFDNGVRIYLRLPSGTMANYGTAVMFAQLRIEDGTTATTFAPQPLFLPPAPAEATRRLVIQSTSQHELSIAADYALLTSRSGGEKAHRSISIATVDITASGANGLDTGTEASATWYAIHLMSDGLFNVRGLLSLSSTAPTLPTGYPYSVLVGWVRNDVSGNFQTFYQADNTVHLRPTLLFTAKGPAVDSVYEAVSVPAPGILATLIPPLARAVRGLNGATTIGFTAAAFAADANGLGETQNFRAAATAGFDANMDHPSAWQVPVVTSQEIYWKALGLAAIHTVKITGFDL